jgi:hypothetical protein
MCYLILLWQHWDGKILKFSNKPIHRCLPPETFMLKEIVHVQQRPGKPERRWFHCAEQDLYVWTDDSDEITAFELCYAKGRTERAVIWKKERGMAYFRVDDGETSALTKSSPVLERERHANMDSVREGFFAASTNVPAKIVSFVASKLP